MTAEFKNGLWGLWYESFGSESAPIDSIFGYAFGSRSIDSTGNDVYSGDHYSGNDGYSGQNPPDDAILFTVSGITAIADKKLEIFK